eukprot:2790188-Amphidinium_carterae.1
MDAGPVAGGEVSIHVYKQQQRQQRQQLRHRRHRRHRRQQQQTTLWDRVNCCWTSHECGCKSVQAATFRNA